MNEPLSDITVANFFNQVKYHLPISKRGDSVAIENWINNALSRYSKIYIDNAKGGYDVTEVYDFYNTENIALNVRGLNTTAETRWCLLQPPSLYLTRLDSCMLQIITPDDLVLPVGVLYVQDIPISIARSLDVNVQIPSGNSGAVALVGGRQLLSVLTLDMTGTGYSFSNIIQITALYTGYRNIIMPNWAGHTKQTIDVFDKDIELICNYVVQEAYLPNKAPISVEQRIRDAEFQIIY